MATRAVPGLLLAGYIVNITDGVFAPDAYEDAVVEIHGHRHAQPTTVTASPTPPPAPAQPRSRTV
ncbi:hypothetical protein ACWEV4_32265 [Streptomyces sp. NPDC003860]